MTRVVVVDDNGLTLPGFVQALTGTPAIEVVAGFDHRAALAWGGDWAGVDVVVVDAADEGRAGDQFPGVAVVRHIRGAAVGHQPLVVVVTGHYLHDGLRHRMGAAGADFFFLRAELRSPAALIDVVLRPDWHRRGVLAVDNARTPQALGVTRSSDVEAFVAWVDGEDAGLALGAEVRSIAPRSRRWARFRRDASDAGRIEPRNVTTGDAPRNQPTPSVRQLSRLWEWAARIRPSGR